MNAPALVLSDNAANKVRQLRESEGNQDLMLRVYVTGGGCSGFSIQGLEGSRFIVENPNATTTCGCGSSFSI